MKRTIKPSFKESPKTLFLEEVRAFKSPDTFRNYSSTLKQFEESFNLSDISPATIAEFVNIQKDRGLRPASINHYLRGLRVYVNWLAKNEYMEHFVVNMVKGQEEEFKCYSDLELKKLLQRPKRNASFGEFRQYTITCWVLATGNRASTVRNIKMKDIDLVNMEIHLKHTKNKTSYVIPLSQQLYKELSDYIRIWRYNASSEDYLFCDSQEGKISASALTNCTRKYNLERGVKITSLHSLRHTFARNYLKNGGNVFMLQRILGHKTLDMTRRYANIICEDLKLNYSSFSALDAIKN